MSLDTLGEMTLAFFRASFFSLGGMSALPVLRQELVTTGYVTDQQLIEALTIGRLGTGPGGLYMVSVGYFALGWAGALIALCAVTLPPLVILPAAAFLRRQLLTAWMAGLVRGLTMATSGLVLTTVALLLFPSGLGADVLPWWQLGLMAVGIYAGVEGRRHPALLIGIGALVGIAFAR